MHPYETHTPKEQNPETLQMDCILKKQKEKKMYLGIKNL
jgi:hypothetical protein